MTRAVPSFVSAFAALLLFACAGKDASPGGGGGQSGAPSGGSSPQAGSAGGGVAGSAGAGGMAAGAAGVAITAGSAGSPIGGASGGGNSIAGAGGGSAGSGGGAGAGGLSENGCPEAPTPRRSSGTIVELSTELVFGGKSVEFGEPAPLADGGTWTPLDFRFYVSEVSLIGLDNALVPVDIVTQAGAPAPYGLHLVTADDPATMRIRLLAPPARYAGISFTLGLNDACNRGSMARKMPLAAASGMTWPHTSGYLFLRYAGRITPGEGADPKPGGEADSALPTSIHLGGVLGILFAPTVAAKANFDASASGPVPMRLSFDFDELFRGANAPIEVTDYPGLANPEILSGERVRRLAPELELFELLPP